VEEKTRGKRPFSFEKLEGVKGNKVTDSRCVESHGQIRLNTTSEKSEDSRRKKKTQKRGRTRPGTFQRNSI